jgi:hypothetical protein
MFPVRFSGVRAVPAAAAAAGTVALAVVTAACGSSGSGASTPTRMAGTGSVSAAPVSASATSAPASAPASASAPAGGVSPSATAPAGTATLTGSAASALATSALANTKDAASVRVAGTSAGTGSGSQNVTFALTLVRNGGCQGTIALSKTESFQIVETGGYAWLLPTTAFYSSLHLSKAALALVQDKYIKVKTTDSQIGDLAKICSFSGLFGSLPKVTGTGYTATPTSYLGSPAYHLTQSGSKGSAFISNAATPLMLEISDPSSGGGVITFSKYGAVTTITPPSAAESIDGSQLGI